MQKSLTLANIYAPNKDNPTFFLDFFGHLDDFKCDDIIVGGVFNLVLDLEKDKSGGIAKINQNSAKIIQEFSDKLDLVDAWRVLHPEARRYTWRRRRPKVQCRLDFFLVNQSVANIATLSDIYPGYKSDHSMMTFKLSLDSNPRGPGLWKLNTSFLTEINYVNQIKATVQEMRDEYREDDSVSLSLLWEMIKLKLGEKSLSYSKTRKKQTKQRETELEQKIAKLEEELDKSNLNDAHISHMVKKKSMNKNWSSRK